ncbi:MAG: class II fructose-bisphosphate aldolase [candidate division NC10 bacterium]|nr:class II fructose-bisphosphate aldolase [candidate division NC10 bacterium]
MDLMSIAELIADLRALALPSGPTPVLSEGALPPGEVLDRWARAAALAEPSVRGAANWAIRTVAQANGLIPASIHGLYAARGRGEWSGRTVPALNLRGWTYQTCRAAFRAARKLESDLLIFEQAPLEMLYADQRPAEYTAAVLAAALREGRRGPIFLQGDHVQVNAGAYARDPAAEAQRLSDLIREQIAAGYFNIDVDASTLVDLSHTTVVEQQRLNAEVTARFTRIIREMEPAGITISVGAEIGEVGAHNTTPDELRAFMATYRPALAAAGDGVGVSKISVNSGTHHGGVVLPDGSLARVTVAFDALAEISRVARQEFGLSGAVQHGASTLPMEVFSRFPESETVEIHLALGFNNLIFDHPRLPEAVKQEIRSYVFTHHADERKPGQTDAQFLYTTRKKAWAGMKARFWDLPTEVQDAIGHSLEEMFGDMFERLKVGGTRDLVVRLARPSALLLPPPQALAQELAR